MIRDAVVDQALAACRDPALDRGSRARALSRLGLSLGEVLLLRERLADVAAERFATEIDRLDVLAEPAPPVVVAEVALPGPPPLLDITVGRLELIAAAFGRLAEFVPRRDFGRSLPDIVAELPDDVRRELIAWLREAVTPPPDGGAR